MPVQTGQDQTLELVAGGPNEVSRSGTLSGVQVGIKPLSVARGTETDNQEVAWSDAIDF